MKGYGGDRFVGKVQILHVRDELDPGVGHMDLRLRILLAEIVGEGPGRRGNKPRAEVAVRENDIRSSVLEHPAEREEPAGQGPGLVDAAPPVRPEMARRVPGQHHQRKTVHPVRLDDIEQVLVGHAARLAHAIDLVGVQDDVRAIHAAVGAAARGAAGELNGVGGGQRNGIASGDADGFYGIINHRVIRY